MELGYKFPEITTWIRAQKKDFKMVRDLEIRETGILVSCSDYHIFKKMNMTRRQAVDFYLETIKDAFDAGIVPRCHLEDITRADFYGFVVPFVNEIMELSEEVGIPVKIRACDTWATAFRIRKSHCPVASPESYTAWQHYAGVPSEMLEWHGHNDFTRRWPTPRQPGFTEHARHMLALGIGERTGNVPLEAMVI